MTFQQMMEQYAVCRGLSKRIVIRTPLLAPKLAARWVGFFTPVPNRLAVPLVQGLIQPLTADTSRARTLFPTINPIPYREAVDLALQRTEKNAIQTRWSGALWYGTGHGRCAAGLTSLSAAPAFDAAVVTPMNYTKAKRLTFGASNELNPTACFVFALK